MKRVAASHKHVYQAPTIEFQCNWLIPEIAITILQHLYYRDIASFSCSCKQTYHLIEQEDFWLKFVNVFFSSNEAPEKLHPRRKFKIYSNLIQNLHCQKSIKLEDYQLVKPCIVWQNRLMTLSQPECVILYQLTMPKLDMLDLKELKIMTENRSIENYNQPFTITGCQNLAVCGFIGGRLDVISNSQKFTADKSYQHCRKWVCLAYDPESKIVAAADEGGTILVWRVEHEPAPSHFCSISINKINDFSVSRDVVVVRAKDHVFSFYYMSEKLISKKLVLPDVSHAAVHQDQLVTSHSEIISSQDKAPVVKIWDAKTIELKETINLAQLSWVVNPRHDMDRWECCGWTRPCMEGVYVSQISVGDERDSVGDERDEFIVVWNLKTKKGSVLQDVDPERDEECFLIQEGQFITTDYDHPNIIKLFDFSHD